MPRITSLLCTSSEMQRGCYWLLGLWALLACAAAVGRAQTPACTHRTVDPRTGATLVFANLDKIAYASRSARGTPAKGQWESREPVGVDETEREQASKGGEGHGKTEGILRCARPRTRRRGGSPKRRILLTELRLRVPSRRLAAISYPLSLLPFFDVVFMRPRRRSN